VAMERIVDKQYYTADELVLHDGLYHSMDHHGLFSGPEAETVLQKINTGIDDAHRHLTQCRFVFISTGTIWVYRYKPTGKIAGNCHKIPQAQFEKIKLSPRESFQALERMYHQAKKIAPDARFIWTVSPVRHLRDGLVENQRSKASLILSAEWMTEQLAECYYFPAYEIMMDQLRDYRYYAEDMIHPNASAIDIIWNLFRETYLDEDDLKVHPLLEKINQGLGHRFLHPNPEAISAFARTQLELIHRVKDMIPELDLSIETQYFQNLIAV
jgi:hypothetical protein